MVRAWSPVLLVVKILLSQRTRNERAFGEHLSVRFDYGNSGINQGGDDGVDRAAQISLGGVKTFAIMR